MSILELEGVIRKIIVQPDISRTITRVSFALENNIFFSGRGKIILNFTILSFIQIQTTFFMYVYSIQHTLYIYNE